MIGKKHIMLIYISILVVLISLTQVTLAQPSNVTVLPGQGISFDQIDFIWPGATTLNSNTSQINVDIATLKASTGISSGYINVYTDSGWVVQNLPIFSGFTYPNISTMFQLNIPSGTDMTSLNAYVEFSSSPTTNFVGGTPTAFPMGNTNFDAQGKGSIVSGGSPVPPHPGIVSFIPGGIVSFCLQFNHPNVQTADSQCGPAAVANSLEWLMNTYGIIVPHPNVPGLGLDGSLVGQLDNTMGRAFINRFNGNGVNDGPFLAGKLNYLAANGLGGNLIVKHQDDGALPGDPGGVNFFAAGLTSFGNGWAPTAPFIIKEVCDCEDVELGYTWSDGGGHWVELVGAGTIAGVPFILYKSDHVQSSGEMGDLIDNNEGTGNTDFSFLVDVEPDGLLNLVNEAGTPNADIVVTESPNDTIPPSVYPLYSTDNYGIKKIRVSDVVNAVITVEGFTSSPTTPTNSPQDYDIACTKKTVTYARSKINQYKAASYRITATDVAGGVTSACPVFFTLPRETGEPINHQFTIYSTENKFSINNSGVTNIRIDINGREFNLISHPDKRGKYGNTYFIPENGEYNIDISSYLGSGDNNITLEARGKPGGSADIVISE